VSGVPPVTEVFRGFHDPRKHYTQVPDYVFDFLLAGLTGVQLKIVYYVARHSFGYGRESAAISWNRFLGGSISRDGRRLDWGAGVSRDALHKALPILVERGLLLKERRASERRGDEVSLYALNVLGGNEQEPSPSLADHRGFIRVPHSTPVPNQLFDVLLPYLSEGELKVLSYIIRRTLGMKEEWVPIGASQFMEGLTTEDGRVLDRGTGVSEPTLKRALRGLEDKRCIVRRRPHGGPSSPTLYSLRYLDDGLAKRGVSQTEHGGVSESEYGGDRDRNTGGIGNGIRMGDQTQYTGGVGNGTHETQLRNTVKDSHEIQQQQILERPNGDGQSDVVVALISTGVTHKIAEEYARTFPAERILAQIDMLAYRGARDPAAVLVTAIKDDWAPPPGYQTPEERAAREREEIAERERWAAARAASAERERTFTPSPEPFYPFQGIRIAAKQVWRAVLTDLKGARDADAFLTGSTLVGRDGDCLVVSVSTSYAAQVLERRLSQEVAAALSAIGGERVRVRFVVGILREA
jgi:DNA-binding MarR family transcriptional regulator